MPISSVTIGNFKGFKETTDIAIKPITVFFGANSSGKSSAIHALACLAQSIRASKDRRPIILDDETANVHLGRFIEVIHSKSYQDFMTLGLGIDDVNYRVPDKDFNLKGTRGNLKSQFNFKCTKRTQEIAIERAHFSVGETSLEIIKSRSKYSLKNRKTLASSNIERDSGFIFEAGLRSGKITPKTFGDIFVFSDIQRLITDELRRTYYLGPFRQPPARRYPTRGSTPREVGPLGESAITLLANEAVQSRSRSHLKQVRGWLNDLGLAKSIEVGRIGTSDLFDVAIELQDGSTFPLADLGYGLSQVLPVLVQCSFASTKSTLLFEQPELHLHPASAKKLSKVFIDTYKAKGVHHLIETHSPDLIKAFFRSVNSKEISKNDFVAYKVERAEGRSIIRPIEIEEDGGIYENWESGFNCD